eukprot:jgi/Orpsp1_1/1189356/evm.model.d7180000071372.2
MHSNSNKLFSSSIPDLSNQNINLNNAINFSNTDYLPNNNFEYNKLNYINNKEFQNSLLTPEINSFLMPTSSIPNFGFNDNNTNTKINSINYTPNQTFFNIININDMNSIISPSTNTFNMINDINDDFIPIFYPKGLSNISNDNDNKREFPLPYQDINMKIFGSNNEINYSQNDMYTNSSSFGNTFNNIGNFQNFIELSNNDIQSNRLSTSKQGNIVSSDSFMYRRKGSLSYTPGFDTEKIYENKKSTILINRDIEKIASKLNCFRVRHILSKSASKLLMQWIKEHNKHPYPTQKEKEILCKETGLTKKQ